MNSYLLTDYSGKTHKKIARKIMRRIASSYSSCLGRKLDYYGMGSLFYEDFRELYSSGCIDRMTSIEYMTDDNGRFDDMKYRRFMLNRPYDSIELLPMTVREAVDTLTFDRNFLTWFDYDSMIMRETIEETADVIRKASGSGMLVSCTGTQIAYSYKAERRGLDMDAVLRSFSDIVTPETSACLDAITWDNFSKTIHDIVTPYYMQIVAQKNIRDEKDYRLYHPARIEYRQPSLFVMDIWLLADPEEIDTDLIEKTILLSPDAGYHLIDMTVLTEREKKIIGDRLNEDPSVLAAELSIEEDAIRKYIRYWNDYV